MPLNLQPLFVFSQFLSHPDSYFVNDQFLRQSTVWLPQVLQRSLEHTFDIPYTRFHDAPVSLLSLRSHLSPTRCLPQGSLSLRGHSLLDGPWYENNCQYVNVRHSEPLWTHLAATHFSDHMSTPGRRLKNRPFLKMAILKWKKCFWDAVSRSLVRQSHAHWILINLLWRATAPVRSHAGHNVLPRCRISAAFRIFHFSL